MKKSSRKTTFLSALAIAVPAMGMAQDKVEASVGADLVSGYIWRGQVQAQAKALRIDGVFFSVESLEYSGVICFWDAFDCVGNFQACVNFLFFFFYMDFSV